MIGYRIFIVMSTLFVIFCGIFCRFYFFSSSVIKSVLTDCGAFGSVPEKGIQKSKEKY
jgi:hypothetical protein